MPDTLYNTADKIWFCIIKSW